MGKNVSEPRTWEQFFIPHRTTQPKTHRQEWEDTCTLGIKGLLASLRLAFHSPVSPSNSGLWGSQIILPGAQLTESSEGLLRVRATQVVFGGPGYKWSSFSEPPKSTHAPTPTLEQAAESCLSLLPLLSLSWSPSWPAGLHTPWDSGKSRMEWNNGLKLEPTTEAWRAESCIVLPLTRLLETTVITLVMAPRSDDIRVTARWASG